MTNELQKREQTELTSASEEMRQGPVFSPAVDIFESDREITVLADMPGISAENLQVDINDVVLTLLGNADQTEKPKRQQLTSEYRSGSYKRQFNISEKIDQEKIEAKLSSGVLRLSLPKIEKAQPRRIAVRSG